MLSPRTVTTTRRSTPLGETCVYLPECTAPGMSRNVGRAPSSAASTFISGDGRLGASRTARRRVRGPRRRPRRSDRARRRPHRATCRTRRGVGLRHDEGLGGGLWYRIRGQGRAPAEGHAQDADRGRIDATSLDTTHRLARFLLELDDDQAQVDAPRVDVEIQLTQEELASLIAASRDTVVRAITSLRSFGFIATARRRITILDINALRHYAE